MKIEKHIFYILIGIAALLITILIVVMVVLCARRRKKVKKKFRMTGSLDNFKSNSLIPTLGSNNSDATTPIYIN